MNPEPTIEQRYHTHIIHHYNRLSLTALPERDAGVKDLPLDKVFVKLNVVVPTPPVSLERGEFSRQRHFPQPADGEENWLERIRRLIQQREVVRPPPPVPISIATALQRYRHLVILGAPGSGKTTLLKWLATTFAQQQQAQPDRLGEAFSEARVPIVLELRKFVNHPPKNMFEGAFDLAEEICQSIDKDANFAEITAEWMSQVLTQQPCLLLLDGLDEIADSKARQRLLEALEAFSQNPKYKKVQCLLTSRFHGFQGIPVGANFQQTEVHPFSEEEVALFIRHWYATAYGETSESQAEAKQLIEAIQANSGVKKLAQNPLLCTITAIVYRKNRELPQRRVELYEECCKILLYTWEFDKPTRELSLIEEFRLPERLELLMPVAYWFHEKNHGQLAVKEEAVEAELIKSLEGLKARGWSSGGKSIDQKAREFIAAIRDRSGLLQGRGDGTLEFTHRTFQEYLAARYIAKQAEAVCIDRVMTHLHEEWWREVHLLVIGHLGSGGDTAEKATRLLLTILQEAYKKPSRWLLPPQVRWLRWFNLEKEWLERIVKFLFNWSLRLNLGTWLPHLQWQRRLAWHLLREFELVAQGYADCTHAGRTPKLAQALSDFAVQRVSQWQSNPFYWAHWNFLLDTLAKYSLPREEVASMLVKELSNRRRWVRGLAAANLGGLGQASPEVVTALLTALQDDNSEVRRRAVESLGGLGQASPEVVTALLKTLQDKDLNVRSAATDSLDRLGQASPEAVTALLKALQDDDSWVRGLAAASLSGLGQASPEVVTALLKALQDDESSVRWIAANSLGRLGQASPEVVTALLKALQDKDEDVRRLAAKSLGRLGQASETVVTALVQALEDDNKDVCIAAVNSLGDLGQIGELVKALDDELSVRRAASANLIRLGQFTKEVVTVQVQALRDKDWMARGEAAKSLGPLKKLEDEELWTEVLIVLQEKLHDGDLDVRQAAFDSLRQLLEGKQIPGYRWRTLEERRGFWQRLKNPTFQKHLLILLVALLFALAATLWDPDSVVAKALQIFGIVGIAYTILPPLLFTPKE
jgi:HEAT repeat protein/energy-coupling factor transporter ATP-binding protein EcfA2